MRKLVCTAALAICALSVPASAQGGDGEGADPAPLAGLSETMGDPARQRELALMLRAMTEVLLDVPIAPLAQAAADMAGAKARDIDPDLTLRKVAPGAGAVGERIERDLPRAMATVGSLADSLAAMTPLIEDMAGRLREGVTEND